MILKIFFSGCCPISVFSISIAYLILRTPKIDGNTGLISSLITSLHLTMFGITGYIKLKINNYGKRK
jgi:hypothetical protein